MPDNNAFVPDDGGAVGGTGNYHVIIPFIYRHLREKITGLFELRGELLSISPEEKVPDLLKVDRN